MSRPMRRPVSAALLLAACCLCAGSMLVASATADETYSVRLRVDPVKVEKNASTQLTAIVEPDHSCTRRAVLFQVKDGGGWDSLGKKVAVRSSCKVSRKVKVKGKSVFRVLLVERKGSDTLIASPGVTVKLR